ncbi:hypothetical protein EV683_11854 [Crenobacter luteus]|nr:hypothetical protein EV683_11854 [Crenobacter luteus]
MHKTLPQRAKLRPARFDRHGDGDRFADAMQTERAAAPAHDSPAGDCQASS